MEKPNYNHIFTTRVNDLWAMEQTHEFPVDIESHYKGLLNMIDVLYYRNGNSYYPKIKTRHAAFFLALSMPSYAYVDPHRTLEMKYNIHAAAIAIENEELTYALDPYNSERIRTLEAFAALAMYKLISEKSINDRHINELAEKIYQRIIENSESQQCVYAYDTIEGAYQVYPNALALMAFQIHDKCFGTDYSARVRDCVLAFIKEHLVEEKTGLYKDCYKTGSLGVKGEHLSRFAAWSSRTPNAASSALAITFMNCFDKDMTKRAWEAHKEIFTRKLLSVSAEQLADTDTGSYLSQLPPAAEGLYASMLAAKEMDDKEYFQTLQDHFMDISQPNQREGKVFFDALGEEQALHGNFLAFARVHAGWNKLLNHNWKDFYEFDYNKVR